MAPPSSAISAFWVAFCDLAPLLAHADSADDPTYERLLAKLHAVDSGLFIEFAASPGANELVVTAEGNRDLFPLVKQIVDAAPGVEGWTVIALKPRLGFPVTARWEHLTVEIADVFFEPLEREGSTELGLRLIVRGLTERDLDDAHNAILRAIDHGLGEESHANAIRYTEIGCLPATASPKTYIPLVELEHYIRRHFRAS
jgi:hypothetical protein